MTVAGALATIRVYAKSNEIKQEAMQAEFDAAVDFLEQRISDLQCEARDRE